MSVTLLKFKSCKWTLDDQLLYYRDVVMPVTDQTKATFLNDGEDASEAVKQNVGTTSNLLFFYLSYDVPISLGTFNPETLANPPGINAEPFAGHVLKIYFGTDKFIKLTFSAVTYEGTQSATSGQNVKKMTFSFHLCREMDSYDVSIGATRSIKCGRVSGTTYQCEAATYSAYIYNDVVYAGNFDFSTGITYNDLPNIYSAQCRLNQETTTSTLNKVRTWLSVGEVIKPIIPDEDNPYDDGGTSEEDGGENTNFSDDSDTPTLDPLPTISAIGTGFATIFNPTLSQLKTLSNLFWGSNFFTFLQNLVENVSDMFISLGMVPFTVTRGAAASVTWLGFDTAITLSLCAEQYYEFDMGSINMETNDIVFRSSSALDYSPFSKLGIYLPFIGYEELDIDECRGSVINLKYRIDILSGACVAIISINGKAIYQFSGNCLTQIPLTNQNMQSLVSDVVQVGIAAATSHSAKGAVASAGEELNEATTVGQQRTAQTHLKQAETHLAQTRSALSSCTANAAMGIKPSFGKTGAVSSAASMLSVKQPYLFLTTPRQSMPLHYQRYGGFPCNITGLLSEFSGLTVVEDIRLNGLVATSDEVTEIYQLLKEGVII